jgi:hypothetical protein
VRYAQLREFFFMAEGKKSFIAYSDWNGMFQALPDDVAGKLIKHIFLYVNDENPKSDDFIINALFEQIKSTLKRDLKKWESQTKQRSEAGKKSAEIRSTKFNDRSISLNEKVRKPTVSVSVNVNDSVNDNVLLVKSDLEIKLIEFYKFRKELKKPIVESSKEQFLQKLKTLSNNNEETAIQILNQSIANGWQGIFEIKTIENGNKSTKLSGEQRDQALAEWKLFGKNNISEFNPEN